MEIKFCNVCGVLFDSTFESEKEEEKGICPHCLDFESYLVETVTEKSEEIQKETNKKWADKAEKRWEKRKEELLIEITKIIDKMLEHRIDKITS